MVDKDNTDILASLQQKSKLIIGSERMFLNSFNQHLIQELKYEHNVILMDADYSVKSVEKRKDKELYKKISLHWKLPYEYRVFIGYGDDCLYFFDLALKYNILFDAAIFVNFLPYKADKFDFVNYAKQWSIQDCINEYKELDTNTKIYNFYGSGGLNKGNWLEIADINQVIPGKLPLYYSKRCAQEIAGVLTYGVYNQNSYSDRPSKFGMVSYSA